MLLHVKERTMAMPRLSGYAAALELDADATLDSALAGDVHSFGVLAQMAASETFASVCLLIDGAWRRNLA